MSRLIYSQDQGFASVNTMINSNSEGLKYYRVMYSGGLIVRVSPTGEPTGQILSFNSVISSRSTQMIDQDRFVELNSSTGGWVVAEKGSLKALEEVNPPKRASGAWYYQVVHPNGMRFSRHEDFQSASDRHEQLHPQGTILRACEKRLDAGSTVTKVMLEESLGWIFENSCSGEVLDRLGDKPVVTPIQPERKTIRNFKATVLSSSRVPIVPFALIPSLASSNSTTPNENQSQLLANLRAEQSGESFLASGEIVQCCELLVCPGGDAVYMRLSDRRGWVLARRGAMEYLREIGEEEDLPHKEWYRVVFQGGVRLRRSASISDCQDVSVPLGCWLKTCRRVSAQQAGLTKYFFQLESCVGARARVDESWVFDKSSDGTVAIELSKEPKVETNDGATPIFVMVLYLVGIRLRMSPHMDAPKPELRIIRYLEVKEVRGLVSTNDGVETYALLKDGTWLPCKANGGQIVACRIPEIPIILTSQFEVRVIAAEGCPLLSAPISSSLSLSDQQLPITVGRGTVVQCNVMVTYSELKKSFLRLQPQSADAKESFSGFWIESIEGRNTVKDLSA